MDALKQQVDAIEQVYVLKCAAVQPLVHDIQVAWDELETQPTTELELDVMKGIDVLVLDEPTIAQIVRIHEEVRLQSMCFPMRTVWLFMLPSKAIYNAFILSHPRPMFLFYFLPSDHTKPLTTTPLRTDMFVT